MNEAFGITQLVDLVIAVTLLECAALALYHRATGRGVAPRDFAVNMLAGLCLMLALRSLASDAGAAWVATWLLAAGVAHGTDIWLRWRRRTGAAGADCPKGEITAVRSTEVA